jgi:hypothetical protein
VGLTGQLDAAGENALLAMLSGRHPNGEKVLSPVLRLHPKARLPATPLLEAIQQVAREQNLDAKDVLGHPRLIAAQSGSFADPPPARAEKRRLSPRPVPASSLRPRNRNRVHNCHPGGGTNVSTIYRNRIPFVAVVCPQSAHVDERGSVRFVRTEPLTCTFLVAGAGFEPATSGL